MENRFFLGIIISCRTLKAEVGVVVDITNSIPDITVGGKCNIDRAISDIIEGREEIPIV